MSTICPPQGDKPHRCVLTVCALKTDKRDIPADATAAPAPAPAGFTATADAIGKVCLTAKYGRARGK